MHQWKSVKFFQYIMVGRTMQFLTPGRVQLMSTSYLASITTMGISINAFSTLHQCL